MDSEPRFLFILTPPYSGSTMLARVLLTSPDSIALERNAEGQWLIPALCDNDRWNPEKAIDWCAVKRQWVGKYKELMQDGWLSKVVIEKSPPNLLWAEALKQHFRFRNRSHPLPKTPSPLGRGLG